MIRSKCKNNFKFFLIKTNNLISFPPTPIKKDQKTNLQKEQQQKRHINIYIKYDQIEMIVKFQIFTQVVFFLVPKIILPFSLI
eukprot:UN00515